MDEAGSALVLINFLFFNACWFALVLGAANGIVWPGILLAAAFLAWEFYRQSSRGRLLALCLAALSAGLVVDGAFVALGVLDYASPWGPLAPAWILTLWVVFALTLRGCLAWLRGRYRLAALFGAIGQPLSFTAGTKLGAASFPGETGLLILGAVWALVTPLLVWFAHAAPLPAVLRSADEAA